MLFAALERGVFSKRANGWLREALAGQRDGLPWLSLSAFARIATNPRATDPPPPLRPDEAWSTVEDWLARPNVWVPGSTDRHPELFGVFVRRYQLTGKLVTDGQLAALAVEHGLTLCSADRRLRPLWRDPLGEPLR